MRRDVTRAGGLRLAALDAGWGYPGRDVIEALSLDIPIGGFTAVVGPNGCGKSTLLHGLAGLLRPHTGGVVLDGAAISELRPKEIARRIGLLGQTSAAPEGITVADLVARGRYPHQDFLRRWSPGDERAVVEALTMTNTLALADRRVDELSGGQRQRVWIAVVLAQQTPFILLDEPTTYLDIANQVELMGLLSRLHRDGRTLVAVLHDLNQASRHATHIVAMRDGRVEASGTPEEVVTVELMERVFDVRCRIIEDPESHTPLVIPKVAR